MKKCIFSLLFVTILLFSLAACSNTEENANTQQNDVAESLSLSEIEVEEIDLSADTGVGVDLVYESDDFIVFYGSIGLFGYDLEKENISFSVDFMKAIGIDGSVQGSRGAYVEVSTDGKTLIISDYDVEQDQHYKTCYIDIPTQTYAIKEYEPLADAFVRDSIKGYIYPGVKTEQVKYILDSCEWLVFENISS